MEQDIFISYTQPDRDVACYMHDMFQNNKLISWMALSRSHGITTGKPFESQVVEAIRSSKVFVLIYSEYCNRSADVIQEIRHRNKLHPTIIVRLDHSVFRADLSYYLTGIQYIEAAHDNLRPAADTLLRHVRKLLFNPTDGSNDSTDQLLFKEGLELFKARRYQEASQKLQRHLIIAPRSYDTMFYLSLATIGGRKIRKMDGLQIRKLEDILSPAASDSKSAGFIKVLLTIIRQDYYLGNGFRMPAPGIGQLANDMPLPADKINDLLNHLNQPESGIWQQLLNHKNKI